MSLPESRVPGQTHEDPRFSTIEELFWTNKPHTTFVYESKHEKWGQLKNPPEIDQMVVHNIWGERPQERLIPSAHIAHLTIFSIPPFMDILDAQSAKEGFGPKVTRFSELMFDQNISTFWVGHSSALGIGGWHGHPESLRANLQMFHQSSRSQKHFDPSTPLHHGEFFGPPDSSLALSVYDVVRIGEDLAIQAGIIVESTDRDNEYEYFRTIVRDAGIWMPDTREEMEAIATELDDLARLNSTTIELTERTIRLAILRIAGVTYDSVAATLRPGARAIFTEVCNRYGYLQG